MRLFWFAVLVAFVMPEVHGETVLKKVEIHVDLDNGEERLFISVESDEEVLIPIRSEDMQLIGDEVDVLLKGEGIVVPPGKHEIKALARAEKRLAGEEYFYYKDITFPYFVEHLLLTIKLPENSFPDVASANFPYKDSKDLTVMPDYVNIENNHVILIWNRKLREYETFHVGVFYPAAKKSTRSAILTLILISILLSLIYYLKNNWKKIREMPSQFLKESKNELTDDEELILSLIKAKGGVALQEEIWKAECITFSRPKVSQILAKLENMGIIRREPFKRTYKIYITDKNTL
jgi:uncharacterized membrane protein